MSYPASRLRLLASVLNTLQIHPSGQLAWITLSQSMMEDAGADPAQTEGMVNFPLSIGGVELVAFFREDEAGGIRVSLRSKNSLDVSAVAQRFGGGGHANAAGLSVSGSLADAAAQVIPALENLLS